MYEERLNTYFDKTYDAMEYTLLRTFLRCHDRFLVTTL